MLLFPYATRDVVYRRPWANYVVMAVTALLFPVFDAMPLRDAVGYYLGVDAVGLVSHLFVHADGAHLAGNLMVLWVFGNAIAARVGHVAYVPLYLGLGVLTGAVHLLFGGGLAVGASGVVNAVIGLYLAFTPKNQVSFIFVWFMPPLARRFAISSYWLIGVWFILDLFGALFGGGGIAYGAHIAGLLLGLGAGVALLKSRLVVIEEPERSLLDLLGHGPKPEPVTEPQRAAPRRPRAAAPRVSAPSSPASAAVARPALARARAAVATPAPAGLRRDPLTATVTCACGADNRVSRLFAADTAPCVACGAPLPLPDGG